jgi:hypothetical protein
MITIRHLLLQRNLLFHQAYKSHWNKELIWNEIHTLQYYLWYRYKVIPFYESQTRYKNAIQHMSTRFFNSNQSYTLYSDGSLCLNNITVHKVYVYPYQELHFPFFDFKSNLYYTTCRKKEAFYLLTLYKECYKKN